MTTITRSGAQGRRAHRLPYVEEKVLPGCAGFRDDPTGSISPTWVCGRPSGSSTTTTSPPSVSVTGAAPR